MVKKWDYSLYCGLPILQKISLRRRESRLAARALPSAVKSIFRRPRSAAFRRHPPYSCLEYGSVDYIIFAPARRASPSVESRWRCHFFVFFPRIVSNPCKKQLLILANVICPSGVYFFDQAATRSQRHDTLPRHVCRKIGLLSYEFM